MRGGYRRVVALCVGAGILALTVLYAPPAARGQASSLPNGGFEDGETGWVLPSPNATWVIDDSIPSPSGGMALHLTATSSTVVVTTQYWTVPVEPGATYRAEAWLRDDSPLVQSIDLRLDYVDGGGHGGGGLDGLSSGLAAGDGDYHLVTTESGVAPAGAAHAVLRIVAETQIGGMFSVDGAAIVQTAAAPPPPTATPTPSATVPPSPPPTASPNPTSNATAKPASTASPTPTPVPVILPILWNADFEDGTGAWSAVAGELTAEAVLGGSFGASLVFRANGAATAWVQQLVTVEPGGWYDASAVLAPLDGVAAARVRVAWYATTTGGGSQIGTVDSEAVASPPPTASSLLYEVVATGPVQAPANAFTARVRIVLQPSSAAGARLAVDDVTFRPVDAPKPKPTPSPSPTPNPKPSPKPSPSPPTKPTVSPTPTADASNTPRPVPGIASDPGGGPGGSTGGGGGSATGGEEDTAATGAGTPSAASAAQWWLRITEVMPDPPQPGRDVEYEWIEITNLGAEATTLAGLSLRDNSGVTALPPLALPPGASAVIAGTLAEVEADARIPGGIGNGLGNEGDRLELLDGQGVVLDALAYGPGLPLVAPRTGDSLHRSFDLGGFAAAARTAPPSPGAYEPFAAVEASEASSTAGSEDGGEASRAASQATSATGGNDLTWVALLAIAGGAVGGAAVQRLGAVGLGAQVRNRFPGSSRISAVETEANPTEREGSHGLG